MEITPYIRNSKKHPKKQIEQVANSIKEFGMNQNIVVDKKGVIIVGHGRYEALKHLGWEIKPEWITTVDLTEDQAKAYRLADNKLNESDWEMGLVIEELKGLTPDLVDLTGFDKDLLIESDEKDDEVPETPEEPKSKLGDLYELGEHRVLCGDSTKIEDVERLMDGKKADLALTDPPYNLGFDYNSYDDNKTKEEYKKFCVDWFNNLTLFTVRQIITPGKQNLFMWGNIREPLDFAIWYSKNKMSGSKIANLALTEPILFYGEINRNSRPTDFFEYNNKVQKDTGNHTCPKTVEFFTDFVKNYSIQSVLDVFLGSGTTLIASEKTGRICYGMELDEKYIDVIVQRYVDFTGDEDIKLNGENIKWQKKS